MKGAITDKTRINHIIDAIGEIEKYLFNLSYEDFVSNSEKKFATIKQIEIVGEACNGLTADFKASHPEIAWKPIKGFRNLSIHEYFAVDFKIVWEIAQNDLPVLKAQFTDILTNYKS